MESCVYLKFFVLENQRHQDRLVYLWLLAQAHELGLRGGSAFRAIAGYGRHGVLHESHFYELAGELPVEVVFVASREEADRLLARVGEAGLSLFYFMMPAESGTTDGDSGSSGTV